MSRSNRAFSANNRRTAALLTPNGRGAVATIRVIGDLKSTTDGSIPTNKSQAMNLDSLFQAVNGVPLSHQPLKKIAFGQWGSSVTEDLIVCRVTPDELEIHCHGGDAAVQRVLNDLATADCEIVDWRAQVEVDHDVLQAECLEILSRTTTWRATQIALEQSNGLLRDTFVRLQNLNSTGNESELNRTLDELLHWSRFGLHLSVPWSVVLTGRPNVGKSSLINALLGYQRAIVFDQPGTTRDVVTGETALDGWSVVLADTAGIRSRAPDLEAAGIALGQERLRTADLPIVVVDLSHPRTIEDEELFRQWPTAIVVANKSDLSDRWGNRLPHRAIKVSSVTGEGVSELQQAIISGLVPDVPMPGTPIPLTTRQIEWLVAARSSAAAFARTKALEGLFVN